MACCIVRADLKAHAEEREEESVIKSEGKEGLMKNGKQGLYNATHVRESACADVWTMYSIVDCASVVSDCNET